MKGQQVVLVGLHEFVYYAVCILYHSKVGNVQCASSNGIPTCKKCTINKHFSRSARLSITTCNPTYSSHFMTTGDYLEGFLVDSIGVTCLPLRVHNEAISDYWQSIPVPCGQHMTSFGFGAKTCRIDNFK